MAWTAALRSEVVGEVIHADHLVAQRIAALDQRELALVDHAGVQGHAPDLVHIARGKVLRIEAALAAGILEPGLDRLGGQRRRERGLERADRVLDVGGQMHVRGQAVARRRGFEQQRGDLVAELVRGHDVRATEREHHHAAQHEGEELVREVRDHALEGLLDAEHAVPDRPVHQRRVGTMAAFGLVALERGGGQIHQRQDVAQARGELLLALQGAAHGAHGDVGDEGEGGREARELLVIAPGFRRHAAGTLTKCEPVMPMISARAAFDTVKPTWPHSALSKATRSPCCAACISLST
jgi:hypothetical protein